MRTIKFRGKCAKESRYAGEWAYGSCVQCEKSDDVLITAAINDRCSCTYHVDPDTVGQFTGLYDKNGKEIYEGDIIEIEGVEQKLEVRFVRGVFAFLWNGDLDDECPLNAPTHVCVEVVGNIHDHPSLIKKGD